MTAAAKTPWAKARKPRETLYNEKREAVLAHAAAMFAERGYDAVSLNDVAERLNVTKPTLYYYFKSKDAILSEIEQRGQEMVIEGIVQAEAIDGDGLTRLRHILSRYIEVVASDWGRCLIAVRFRRLEPGARQKIHGRGKIAEDRILAIMQQGMDDGSIKSQDLKIAYQALFGMLNWISVWYKDSGPVRQDAMTAQVIEMLVNGIKGQHA